MKLTGWLKHPLLLNPFGFSGPPAATLEQQCQSPKDLGARTSGALSPLYTQPIKIHLYMSELDDSYISNALLS